MIIDQHYLFSKKLGVGRFFGVTEDDVTIEFRETDVVTTTKFQTFSGDTSKATEFFVKMLPGIIVDHDLWKDEAHKYTADEIAAMIAGRAELCIDIMGRYVQEVLFTHGKKSDSKL
ncbi:MAG: hypothetical protein NT080_00330 [Spirochaetes bacterium]|nr:hypothetical protein [Spirochaetota bacterium]